VTDLVVDSSVAIKWFVEEPGSEEALALFQHHLHAPELLIAECANVLWKKARRNELTTEEASLCARLLQRADIDLSPMRPLLESATRLSVALDHPAYDCFYLALAESLSCDLVTADARLVAKVLATSGRPNVRVLAARAPP
jgi:predicted nucleic acid-binding protein